MVSPNIKICFYLYCYCFIGQNVSLECTGVGNPVPMVSWRRVNSELPPSRAEPIPGGLRITNVQLGDQGQYVCELSNGVPPMAAHLVTLEVQGTPLSSFIERLNLFALLIAYYF